MALLYTQPTSKFQHLVHSCLVRRAHHHAAIPKSQLLYYEDVIAAKFHVCSTVLSVAHSLLLAAAQGRAIYVSRIPLPMSQCCNRST